MAIHHLKKKKKKKQKTRRKFNQSIKDLYDENYATLKKEFPEVTRKWKNSHVHGSSELIL
jgi:prefoldin subunit 5